MSDAIVEITKALNEYGPALVVTATLLLLNGFFIYRDWLREKNQQRQLDELHKVHNQVVLPLLTECKEAIGACTEVIRQNNQLIQNLAARQNG
jgi:hypothetical protein